MQFVVQSGVEPGRTYDVKPGKMLSIGRQSINEIVVSDEQASRKHAEIELTPSGVLVTDKNSANGTFVNGTRISSSQMLKPGDTLQIGTTVLKLVDSDSGASTVASGYEQPAPPSGGQDYAGGYATVPGVGSYGQQPSGSYSAPTPAAGTPAYGSNYSAPAQPQQYAAGGYDQNQAAYGQQPHQYAAGGYDQNQPGYGQQPQQFAGGYDPNQAAYGQQPQYGAAPVAVTPAKKSNMGLIIGIVVGIVALAAILVVLFAFVLKGDSAGAVGDLPAPNNATKIELSGTDLDSFTKTASIPAGSKTGFYTTSETPTNLKTFYDGKMKDKGYTAPSIPPGLGNTITAMAYQKDTKGAGVVIFGPLKDSDIQAFEGGSASSSLKGKFKAGDSLVILFEANIDTNKR